MKINCGNALGLFITGAFCLLLLSMNVSEIVAMEQSPFVQVATPDISYDTVSGTDMVKNGSKVFIEIVLTNFPKEVKDLSHLYFSSDLGVYPTISVDGVGQTYKIPFDINHQKVNEVKIVLSGNAPEVYKRTEDVTLLNITQKIGTQEEEYLIIDIKRDISSELIEDAIKAINNAKAEIEKANLAIADATAAGVDVTATTRDLELANEHLNNSLERYNEGNSVDAVEEADKAAESAQEAANKATASVGSRTQRNYGVIAAVVVIVVVVLVLVLQKQKRKRGVY